MRAPRIGSKREVLLLRSGWLGSGDQDSLQVMNSKPDEILAELAKQDPEAFGIIYRRHVRAIYSYIYCRTGNVQDAEDLTARTFYQALSHIHGYRAGASPFAAWLFRIAHNLVANWYRDNSRRRSVPLDGAFDRDSEHDPTADTLGEESASELRRAIASLPAERQQLLMLKFVEELPNAAIARSMGRTEGAVKALLHRTVVTLRDELARSAPKRLL
jgi:RNA polymerase sigma-70 factor (ECF subfamily)